MLNVAAYVLPDYFCPHAPLGQNSLLSSCRIRFRPEFMLPVSCRNARWFKSWAGTVPRFSPKNLARTLAR